MDDRFLNAFIGSETSVFGYKLRSLTPWHYLLLKAVNSPILDAGAEKSTDDVLIFLKITSCQWPAVPNLRTRWHDVFWNLNMKMPGVVKRQMARLAEWLQPQLSIPEFWANDNAKESTISAPPILALVVGLTSKGGILLSDAWNMRMAEARWFDATLAELNGADIKIAYEGESEEISANLQKIDDEQQVKIAQANLAPENFKKWLAAHKARQQETI